MTLLISFTAAVIVTAVWYIKNDKGLQLEPLMFMFWGASLMWLVDAIFEFAELREEYFAPEAADMLNDTFLGLSVVVLALVIWVIMLLIKDPKGVLRKRLTGNK